VCATCAPALPLSNASLSLAFTSSSAERRGGGIIVWRGASSSPRGGDTASLWTFGVERQERVDTSVVIAALKEVL